MPRREPPIRAIPATILLDNEAVNVLLNPQHRKHQTLMAHFAFLGLKMRKGQRQRHSPWLCVPLAVRVEANWSRRRSGPGIEKERTVVREIGLDSTSVDLAAEIHTDCDVSVADAHLGAALTCTDAPHAIITSDRPDVTKVAAYCDVPVHIVVL